MKTCMKLLQNCTYHILTLSSRNKIISQSHSRLIQRSITTAATNFDHFHPYNPSYYYDQQSESDVNKKRTTYADLSPCKVDKEMIKLLSAAISNNGFTTTNARADIAKKTVVYRLSDDFWNSSTWFLHRKNQKAKVHLTQTGARSYSTRPDQTKTNQQNSSEEVEETQRDSKDETSNTETDLGQKTKREQLKIIFAQYGAFGVAFHIAMSLCSLGFFYLLVSSGIDVVGLLAKLGIELSGIVSGASTFVIAYAVHKIAMPVRVSITVVSVPILVRYLRRIGLFKK